MFLAVAGILMLTVLLCDETEARAASRPEVPDKVLLERIEALEKGQKKREDSSERALLRSRVTELERLMRENRGGSLTMAPKADLRDVSRLQRENATLQRKVMSLESKVSTLERAVAGGVSSGVSSSSLQRGIDSLSRSVARLQNAVQRLESRR